MKTSHTQIARSRAVIFGAILAGSLLFNPLAQATEKAGSQVQIPATSEAIWKSIDKETEQLAALIQTGKFEEVHHHAFAIRDLVAALPARSGTMPGDKLAQIKSDSKFVATLAERLDAAGDARDKTATETNFQKLKGVLKSLRANYSGSGQK